MRHEQINFSVSIQVRRDDDRGGLSRQWDFIWKAAFAIIEAHMGRHRPGWVAGTIGRDDVSVAVAIEVGHRDVTRGPLGAPEAAGGAVVSPAIVEVNHFAVGTIVADGQVQAAVAIQISQRG